MWVLTWILIWAGQLELGNWEHLELLLIFLDRLILSQGDEYVGVCCTVLLFFSMFFKYLYYIYLYKYID